LLTTIVINFAFSQENYNDVIYLKNGSIIKGQIIELKPDKSIKIETKDKKQYNFTNEEIDKFSRENSKEIHNKIDDSLKNDKVYRHVVKTDPLSYLMGYYKFMDEIKFSKRISGNFILGYLSKGLADEGFTDQNIKSNGFIVSPELRFYLLPKNKESPEGFYIAPWIRYEYERIKVKGMDMSTWAYSSPTKTSTNVNINALGFGINLGIQLIASKFFSIDFFSGCGYGFLKIDGAKKNSDGYYEFVQPNYISNSTYDQLSEIETHKNLYFRVGLNLGIAF